MYEILLAPSKSPDSRTTKVAVFGTVVSFHAAILATIVVMSAWRLAPVGEPSIRPVFHPDPVIPISLFTREPSRPPVTPARPAAAAAPHRNALVTPPPTTAAAPLTQPTTVDLPIPTGPESPVAGTSEVTGPGFGPGDAAATGFDTAGSPDVAIQFGRGMIAPQVLRRVEPIYPNPAMLAHKEGAVIVEAEIDTQGQVRSARVVSPRLGFGLEESALTAVKAWRFEPARLGDRAIAVYFRLTVQFRLMR